ncbi:DUF1211 domain-containing protein [Candidatus Peregrinibacteria bacterium]|nr:DUF1211 domain-containing protein [Candidatus Peregrinibacteria bacterium]
MYLNKSRVDTLSDGVFAIVMTLLVLEINIPHSTANVLITPSELLRDILQMSPLYATYIISFAVLSIFWTSHHTIFHYYAKTTNKALVQLNMLFLAIIALIPFSSRLLSEFHYNQTAVIMYGANMLLAGIVTIFLFTYALKSREIYNGETTPTAIKQTTLRLFMTPSFAIFGIFASFVSIPASLILFAFPIIFNIIPGTITYMEKKLRLI